MTTNTLAECAKDNKVYQVAIPSPLRTTFDYLADTSTIPLLTRGCRVKVPFGNRKVIGIVVGDKPQSEIPTRKLKAIEAAIDTTPLIPEALFKLFCWAANYYQHPIGEALATVFPVLLRKGIPPVTEQQSGWRLSALGKGLPTNALKNAPKQQQLLQLLQEHEFISSPSLKEHGLTTAITRQLEKKSLIEKTSVNVGQIYNKNSNGDLLSEHPLPLYPQQKKALQAITPDQFNCYLLHGETGSGKTEVYLQAIAAAVSAGKQALVLIPEISLTPQTVSRFEARFNCPIVLLHSGLTDQERALAWNKARTGEASIIIGTRSAVFTPTAKLGIVIIDEEHDSSYKQQEGYRYHARDLSVMRAQQEAIPIMLGSATPSLESLYNCQQKRYLYLPLPVRAGNARPPDWAIVNIKGQALDNGISMALISAIKETLSTGNQVLVFLNRRGFAPTLSCHDCGWIAACPRCDARLTMHRYPDRMICHHCEYQPAFPKTCPTCNSDRLAPIGQGTARAEETLAGHFPDTPIIRIDRDTTRKKHAMSEMVEHVNAGDPCILVGTQMLAKGHHFPDVTLVAILDADAGLFSPDFRAPEKMAQLLVQVAGRSGRGSKSGRVLLQSYYAEHPFLQELSQNGYKAFTTQLLSERQLATLPPYSYMIAIRAESTHAEQAEAFLRLARTQLESLQPPSNALSYLGPLPSPMEKRRGRYRFQLTITGIQRKPLNQLVAEAIASLESAPLAKKVRWSIDVDPQDMS